VTKYYNEKYNVTLQNPPLFYVCSGWIQTFSAYYTKITKFLLHIQLNISILSTFHNTHTTSLSGVEAPSLCYAKYFFYPSLWACRFV